MTIPVTRPALPPLAELYPYLEQIWSSAMVSNSGPLHQQLEQALADFLGVAHLSLFNNGTIALMAAIKALDLSGSVITTPFSFPATSHAIVWNGLTPIFADTARGSFNIDPHAVRAAIRDDTSAILAVHCYGMPCDHQALAGIAAEHNLHLIYDAAHAFAVDDDQGSILQLGDLSVLSLHATKAFHTLEGGAIIAPSAAVKARIDQLRNFGLQADGDCDSIGLNGKMHEVSAAIGLLMLNHYPEHLARRRDIAQQYHHALADCPQLTLPNYDGVRQHNYAYFPVTVNSTSAVSRDRLFDALQARGIGARKYFHPLIADSKIYRQQFPGGDNGLDNARALAASILCLPIYPTMTDADCTQVIDAVLSELQSGDQ